jgi:hypothetical protein
MSEILEFVPRLGTYKLHTEATNKTNPVKPNGGMTEHTPQSLCALSFVRSDEPNLWGAPGKTLPIFLSHTEIYYP